MEKFSSQNFRRKRMQSCGVYILWNWSSSIDSFINNRKTFHNIISKPYIHTMKSSNIILYLWILVYVSPSTKRWNFREKPTICIHKEVFIYFAFEYLGFFFFFCIFHFSVDREFPTYRTHTHTLLTYFRIFLRLEIVFAVSHGKSKHYISL